MYELLQIVEVDQETKVRCCAPGCNRSVYKKVHVVRDNNEILVLGETCFRLKYKGRESKTSDYYSGTSRQLSSEERKLLIENTEILIALFEKEYKEKKEQERIISAQAPAPAPKYATKQKVAEVILDGTERYVSCLYCGCRMPTKLQSKPAKGFKCVQCKETGATLPPRKTRKSRW